MQALYTNLSTSKISESIVCILCFIVFVILIISIQFYCILQKFFKNKGKQDLPCLDMSYPYITMMGHSDPLGLSYFPTLIIPIVI